MNTFKTALLMTTLTVLLILLGSLWGGTEGAMMLFLFSLGLNFLTYWFSDRWILLMYNAKRVSRTELPEVYRIVEELTKNNNMPMPKIYLIPTTTPNAFATGRNPQHAAVAVTEGILQLLNYEELRGVLAHELAHIKNRDTLIATIVAALAGAIMMISRMAMWGAMLGGGYGRRDSRDSNGLIGLIGLLVSVIIAPIAALLIQLAISRNNEFRADATGAKLARNPHGLANALLKLNEAVKIMPMQANPATAHLFIVNPLKAESIATLFSTHPPVAERVARLRSMTIY